MEEEEGSKEDFIISSEGREGSQESGWTGYFEDFLKQGRGLEITSSSAYEGPPSTTVSDAASAAAQNLLRHVRVSAPPKACKRLEFKRRKTKSVLDEDPLEDTATSPLSSPKVSRMSLDIGSCKKEENCAAAVPENSSINRSPLQPEGRNQMLQVPAENDYRELKKRGLCLVPLSMLVDYTGCWT